MTSTDVSTVSVLFSMITAAKVSPLCSDAGISAVMDSGTLVTNFWGGASPKPRVGCTANAPTVHSPGFIGDQRSPVPLPSLLEVKLDYNFAI